MVSKQGIAWQNGAQEHVQRCGALSAHWAEAAHLNSLVGAPMHSSESELCIETMRSLVRLRA